MKKILMVLTNARSFPPDIRVEKEAKALDLAGYKVRIMTPRMSREEDVTARLDDSDVEIVRVDWDAEKRTRLSISNCLKGFFNRDLMLDPQWARLITGQVAEFGPDAVHVHDLDQVPTAVEALSETGLPLVADLHENMPAAVRAWMGWGPWKHRFLGWLRASVMERAERSFLPRCAQVILVVPEAAERLKAFLLPEQITIVSNTESEETFPEAKEAQPGEGCARSPGVPGYVTYVGGVGPHRGVDTAVRAMKHLPDDHGLVLRIVGAKPADRERLEDIAKADGTSGAVEIVEWVPMSEVHKFIDESLVCLVPHADTEHTQTTVPHKLFQYMIVGRPVLVSDCAPLKRIVKETGAGEVFKADDAQDFAKVLHAMAQDERQLKAFSRAGFDAARASYSWERDSERLVKMYERVLGS